jgi:hypothetical protein
VTRWFSAQRTRVATCDADPMSVQTWRQVYGWVGVTFWGAWTVASVRLLLLDDDPAGQRIWWLGYAVASGLFLLCDRALRIAERRDVRSRNSSPEHI